MNVRRFISKLTAWPLTFALILALASMFTPAAGANDTSDPSVVTVAITAPGTDAAIPFTDVSAADWFASSVMLVFENGFMTGTSTVPMMFSPGSPATRGMIVTVLYSVAGSPPVGNAPFAHEGGGAERRGLFTDVPEDAWYADAVAWAAANGIVSGYGNGRFGPDVKTTRQDLAVIINNFARYAGQGLPVIRGYTAFGDERHMDAYAVDSIVRLYKAGIINGKPGNVYDPKGSATRAELAAMLASFLTAQGFEQEEDYQDEDYLEVDYTDEDYQDEAYPDEVYKEMMLAFEDSFSELLYVLIDIAIEVDFVGSEDDIDSWRKFYPELRDAVENEAAHLADMASLVPAKYAEAHRGYTMVAEYVLNALTAFNDAVEAAFDEGDEDAAIIAINEFLNDMLIANEEWLIARTGLASIIYAEEMG